MPETTTSGDSGPIAVVLLSGGLDSATALAIARNDGFDCRCLAFDYGQRHRFELDAAAAVAASFDAPLTIFKLDLAQFGGSALTADIDVPKDRPEGDMAAGIPITYVPARNTVFLSIALAMAETLSARDIFIGVNAIDYSGYPDCRPEFIASFEETANLATKLGVESGIDPGERIRIQTPLQDLTKAQIIARGTALGVDYALTHSCYDPADDGASCGRCDSCQLRRSGFEQASVPDPTRYAVTA